MPFTLHGLAVSQGIAIGHAHLVSHALLEVNHYHVAEKYLNEETERRLAERTGMATPESAQA